MKRLSSTWAWIGCAAAMAAAQAGPLSALEPHNLVQNPGFEADADRDGLRDGWRRWPQGPTREKDANSSLDHKIAHRGKTSARISVNSNAEYQRVASWVTPSFKVRGGAWLLARVWPRSERLSGRMRFLYWFGDDKGKRITQYVGPITPGQGKWQAVTLWIQAPPNAAIARLDLVAGLTVGAVWFDDLCVVMMGGKGANNEDIDILPGAVRTFDFGTRKSVAFFGFVHVPALDEYGPGRGYGWRGRRKGVERIARHNGEIPFWMPVSPDPLTYDFVYARDAKFEVDLPNGPYVVFAITGDIGRRADPPLGLKTGYTLSVEGKTVANVAPLSDEAVRRKWLWAYCGDDWRPGRDIWKRYIEPLFTLHRAVVDVKDGRLTLALHNCPLDTLVIYTATRRDDIRRAPADLETLRRSLFPFYETTFHNRCAMPLPSDEATRKGYVVFPRHYQDEVLPDTTPTRAEMGQRGLHIAAAGNEYESATFAIRALRPLHDVRVSVGDLVNEQGHRRPRQAVDVRVVRDVAIAQARPRTYRVCPLILVRRDDFDIPEGTAKWVWLTVRVRKGAPAGRYRGAVRIAPHERPATELQFTVDVLLFDLPDRVEGKYYAILCNWPPPALYGEVWPRYAARFPQMKAHGMETLYLAAGPFRPKARWAGDHVEIENTDFLRKTMALYRRVGMSENRVLCNTAFDLGPLSRQLAKGDAALADRIYIDLLKTIDTRARREGWPDFFYTNTGYDSAKPEAQARQVKLVKRVGVRVWDQQGNPKTIEAIAGKVDLFLILPPAKQRARCAKLIHAKGKQFGFHNRGLFAFFRSQLRDMPMARASGVYRFFYGWWFWRSGGNLMGDEFYDMCYNGQPYNPLDGMLTEMFRNDFCGIASPSPGGPQPLLRYEWMREGRDDVRYIAAIEKLIARAEAGEGGPKAKQTAAQARAFLKQTADSIDIDAYETRWNSKSPWWPLGQYDRLRHKTADYIIALRALLPRGAH